MNNKEVHYFRAILLMVTISIFTCVDEANGQYNYNPYIAKPGACPPPLPVSYCYRSCLTDAHCQGFGKCCPTSCGGTTCSQPVTPSNTNNAAKAGSCPAKPTGKWVCTPTCSTDADCPGLRKCCKNRCGAMACQKPETPLEDKMMGDAGSEPGYNVPENYNPYAVFAGDYY